MSSKKYRSFSAQFQAEIVLTLLSGQKSAAQICREHELERALEQEERKALMKSVQGAMPKVKVTPLCRLAAFRLRGNNGQLMLM